MGIPNSKSDSDFAEMALDEGGEPGAKRRGIETRAMVERFIPVPLKVS